MFDPHVFLVSTFISVLFIWAVTLFLLKNKQRDLNVYDGRFFKIGTEWFNKIDLIGIISVIILLSCLTFYSAIKKQASDTTPVIINETINAIITIISSFILFGVPSFILLFLLSLRVNLFTAFGLKNISWRQIMYAVIGGMILSIALLAILDLLQYDEWMNLLFNKEGEQAAVDNLLKAKSWQTLGAITVSAVIIAPITEEVLFRGILYGATKKYSGGIFALLSSSLLFAIVHAHATNLFPLFIIGVLLALVYEYSGSLIASISMHALFNLLNVIMMTQDKTT